MIWTQSSARGSEGASFTLFSKQSKVKSYVIFASNEKTLHHSWPNGAGKTTASYTILPEIFDCREFVNADKIAKGISPFNPDNVGIKAGHNIPKEVIERRFKNGLHNLFNLYIPVVDK